MPPLVANILDGNFYPGDRFDAGDELFRAETIPGKKNIDPESGKEVSFSAR